MEKKYNTTLIIGNGFDRSLGMNTSYESFFLWLESSLFFEKHKDNALLNHVYTRGKQENWYAFENIIRDFTIYEPTAILLRRGQELRAIIDAFRKCKASTFDKLPQYKDMLSVCPSLQVILDKIASKQFIDSELVIGLSDTCKKALSELELHSSMTRKGCLEAISLLTSKLEEFLRKATPKHGYSPAITLFCSVLGLETKGFVSMADSCVCRYCSDYEDFLLPQTMIVSFNYTDTIREISHVIEMCAGRAIGLDTEKLGNQFYQIHGKLGATIAFGTDDAVDIPSELWGLRKSAMIEEHAKERFYEILNDSKRIVIFGHSLYDIDFEYYKRFFEKPHNDTQIYVVDRTEDDLKKIQQKLEDRHVSPKLKYRVANNFDDDFMQMCHDIYEDENAPMAQMYLAVNSASIHK